MIGVLAAAHHVNSELIHYQFLLLNMLLLFDDDFIPVERLRSIKVQPNHPLLMMCDNHHVSRFGVFVTHQRFVYLSNTIYEIIHSLLRVIFQSDHL